MARYRSCIIRGPASTGDSRQWREWDSSSHTPFELGNLLESKEHTVQRWFHGQWVPASTRIGGGPEWLTLLLAEIDETRKLAEDKREEADRLMAAAPCPEAAARAGLEAAQRKLEEAVKTRKGTEKEASGLGKESVALHGKAGDLETALSRKLGSGGLSVDILPQESVAV